MFQRSFMRRVVVAMTILATALLAETSASSVAVPPSRPAVDLTPHHKFDMSGQ